MALEVQESSRDDSFAEPADGVRKYAKPAPLSSRFDSTRFVAWELLNLQPRSFVPKDLLGAAGDDRVCVAILDGRPDLTHPCFAAAQVSPTANDDLVDQVSAHGTAVASIIFGQPGTSVEGISPRCRGLVIPVFRENISEGMVGCSQLELGRAITSAVLRGANVINISGGKLSQSAQADPVLARALETCQEKNVLVVAASGNDGCNCIHIPAAVPFVLAVGALNREGNPLDSNNWGDAYQLNGILAPGEAITVADLEGKTSLKDGSSFAAAIVSGFAALLAGILVQRNGRINMSAIRDAIIATADPCPYDGDAQRCRRFLGGRINSSAAMQWLNNPFHPTMEATVTNVTESSATSLASGAKSELEFRSGAYTATPDRDETINPPDANKETSKILMSDIASVRRTDGNVASNALALLPSSCACGGTGGSACTCGKSPGPSSALADKAYAIGTLAVDFGTEARRDSFIQAMPQTGNNPHVASHLLQYLKDAPYDAASVTWVLKRAETPMFAVQPVGPYAAEMYQKLRDLYEEQQKQPSLDAALVSMAGHYISGRKVRLYSGIEVEVLYPTPRGMNSFSIRALVEHALGPRPEKSTDQKPYDHNASMLSGYLSKIYYKYGNEGRTPEERALNHSAVNIFQIKEIVQRATVEGLDMGDIFPPKRSPICRPESDCFDVEVSFHNPSNLNIADRVFSFTVDVGDVHPVTIGPAYRTWTQRR